MIIGHLDILGHAAGVVGIVRGGGGLGLWGDPEAKLLQLLDGKVGVC